MCPAGNVCLDGQCPKDWSCVGGQCVPDICTVHTDCLTDWVCLGGACKPLPDSCTPGTHTECPGSLICSTAGTCVVCDVGTGKGCGAGETCNATTDGLGECEGNACRVHTDCPNGWACGVSGTCVELPPSCTPGVHNGCPGNLICSTAGTCVVCDVGTNEGCGAGETCNATTNKLGECER